jgi:hypothetical protein
MNKHTPGPWKCGANEAFVYALNNAGTNRFFAGVNAGWLTEGGTNKPEDKRTSHEEVMANARLIAAAPELLTFAKSVVTLFAEAYPKAGLHLDMDKASLLNAAREVIKKARGE